MYLTLIWDGQRIPNLDAPFGTRDAIYGLGLDDKTAENLWALWCSLDALLDEDDVELWDDAAPDEIADLLSHPDFIKTAADRTAENPKDDGYDWAGLPDFVRSHADKLQLAA
jgi:hypothetical protein